MKTLICFLLPVLLFAQNPYPDTLQLIDGREYPCLITGIDDTKLSMIYADNRDESIILRAVGKVVLENNGTIFSSGTGFSKDLKFIQSFISSRLKNLDEEIIIQEELSKLSPDSENTRPDITKDIRLTKIIKNQHQAVDNNWSFGILLIPYYSGTLYRVVYGSGYYPQQITTLSYTNNEMNMEGQLSFKAAPKFHLTLNATYTSSFSELRSESHSRGEYNNYDAGDISTVGLKLFDLNIGVKYYFLNMISERVTIYGLAGVGKQFAFAENKFEILFQTQVPPYIVDDNMEEYLEGLNSPWHFNIGFGAEYFFNESLSLVSNIRFLYSAVSAKYNYRYVAENVQHTNSIDYKRSDFITRIGLGLNFYF